MNQIKQIFAFIKDTFVLASEFRKFVSMMTDCL